MPLTELIVFLLGPALQAWLGVLLIRRGAHKSFRFFFAYTLFSILAGIAKFVSHGTGWRYFYVAWTSEAVYAVLGFAATLEVFHHVFRNFRHQKWIRLLLPAISMLMLAPALWWVFQRPLGQMGPLLRTIFPLEIVVRCLQAGVFLVVFGLARFFNLYWRQQAFGIATGFFVSTFGLVLSIMVRSEFVTKHPALLNYGPSVSYIIAVLIWLISFYWPEPDPFQDVRHRFTPDLFIERLEQYRKGIQDLLKPWSRLIRS